MSASSDHLNDPGLPLLSEALDTGKMLGYCQRLVVEGSKSEILACRVLGLRHRRAQRCIIQYEVDVRLPDGSVRQERLSGYQYAEKLQHKLRTRKLERVTPGACSINGLHGFLLIEEIGLRLQCFPYDHRLPSFASFYFNLYPIISEHLAELTGGDFWKLDSLDCQLARWRTGLSAVLRIDFRLKHKKNGKFRHQTVFAKFSSSSPEGSSIALDRSADASDFLPFKVPSTLVSLPERNCTLQSAARGQSLEYLLVKRHSSSDYANLLARFLGQWQVSGISLPRDYTSAHFEKTLNRSVRTLVSALPGCRARLDRLATTIVAQMNPVTTCPAHLDLKPEHLFFHGNDIAFIDTDSARNADPMIEISILYARLIYGNELYGLPELPARRFANQFINSYYQQTPHDWWQNFNTSFSWAILKVAVHLYASRRPDWQQKLPFFIAKAEKALSSDCNPLPFLDNNPALFARSRKSLNFRGPITSGQSRQ